MKLERIVIVERSLRKHLQDNFSFNAEVAKQLQSLPTEDRYLFKFQNFDRMFSSTLIITEKLEYSLE